MGALLLIVSIAFIAIPFGQRYVQHVAETLESTRVAKTAPGSTRAPAREAVIRAALPEILRPLAYLVMFLVLGALGTLGLWSLFSLYAGERIHGPLVWQFIVYFSTIALWIAAYGVVILIARRRGPADRLL